MYPTKAEHEVPQQMVTTSAAADSLLSPTRRPSTFHRMVLWPLCLLRRSFQLFPHVLLPRITFGQIAEIVDEGSPACALSGGLYAALCYFTGCACCYACVYRNKMRAKYNLAESPCTDCLVHCFCDSCALCQEYRELKHRGFDPALGWRGPGQQKGMGHAMAAPGYATMQK